MDFYITCYYTESLNIKPSLKRIILFTKWTAIMEPWCKSVNAFCVTKWTVIMEHWCKSFITFCITKWIVIMEHWCTSFILFCVTKCSEYEVDSNKHTKTIVWWGTDNPEIYGVSRTEQVSWDQKTDRCIH